MSLKERLFLRRLRERDEKAFRELVSRHQDMVYNLMFRMTGSSAESEELAQEVFVTVFKRVDQFRGDSKLSTWIYRMAVNHCKNRMKYLARRRYKQTGPIDAEATADSRASSRPDRQAEGVERERMVQDAIALLDEDHRILIVLRDIEELSYDEIIEITGLAPGTVKSRLHRARLALRGHLTGYIQETDDD